MGVVPHDDGVGLVPAPCDGGPDIKRVRRLAVCHADAAGGHNLLCPADNILRYIGQNGQPAAGVIQQRAQRGGQRKTDVAGAGNADADAVFIEIRADQHLYLLRLAAKSLRGSGHRQTDAAGIGAAGGGLDFRGQNIQQIFSFLGHICSPCGMVAGP